MDRNQEQGVDRTATTLLMMLLFVCIGGSKEEEVGRSDWIRLGGLNKNCCDYND